MFTADGQLREEYRHIESDSDSEAVAAAAPSAPLERQPEPPSPAAPAGAEPVETLGADAPSFLDLVALLAEPASIYLQQAQVPNVESAQNLELARLHIDLLALVKQKTSGNLTEQEKALLEDALYQLRRHYLELRG